MSYKKQTSSFPTLCPDYKKKATVLQTPMTDKFDKYIQSIIRSGSKKSENNSIPYYLRAHIYIKFEHLFNKFPIYDKSYYIESLDELASKINEKDDFSYDIFSMIKGIFNFKFTISMKLGNDYTATELETSGLGRIKYAKESLKLIIDDINDRKYMIGLSNNIDNENIKKLICDFIAPKWLFTLSNKEIVSTLFNIYVSFAFGQTQKSEYDDWIFG